MRLFTLYGYAEVYRPSLPMDVDVRVVELEPVLKAFEGLVEFGRNRASYSDAIPHIEAAEALLEKARAE